MGWFFWFLMGMDALIPASMIGFGVYFRNHAPKVINSVYGYRTRRSMKNREAWEAAHRHFGKLWYRWGLWLLLASVAAFLAAIGRSEEFQSWLSMGILLAQSVCMILPIFFTESYLKKNF